jgi:hypothetical protein
VDATADEHRADAHAWWEARRKLYNIALLLAGLGAFACYAAVLEHFSCSGANCPGNVEDTEITIFTILFQAVGYLVAMAVANVAFGLGAVTEAFVRPTNTTRWRRTCFALGLSFSVALPFMVPALVALRLASRH